MLEDYRFIASMYILFEGIVDKYDDIIKFLSDSNFINESFDSERNALK